MSVLLADPAGPDPPAWGEAGPMTMLEAGPGWGCMRLEKARSKGSFPSIAAGQGPEQQAHNLEMTLQGASSTAAPQLIHVDDSKVEGPVSLGTKTLGFF